VSQLSGRLAHVGLFKRKASDVHIHGCSNSHKPRLPNERGKEHPHSFYTNNMVRRDLGGGYRDLESGKIKADSNKRTRTKINLCRNSFEKRDGIALRQDSICLSNSSPSQSVVPTSHKGGTIRPSRREKHSKIMPTSNKDCFTPVVKEINLEDYPQISSRITESNCVDRCILARMGCNIKRCHYSPGRVDRDRKGGSYQRSRAESCPPNLEQHRYQRLRTYSNNGQRGNKICPPEGQINLTNSPQTGHRDLPTMPRKEYKISYPPSPNCPQYHRRQIEQRTTTTHGNSPISGGLQNSLQLGRGNSSGGLDGNCCQQQDSSVCQSIPRSSSRINERVYDGMESVASGVHISSPTSSDKTSAEDQELQRQINSHCSLDATISVVRRSLDIDERPLASKEPVRRNPGTRSSEQRVQQILQMDRVSFIKSFLIPTRGQAGTEIILRGYRDSSIRQAQSSWKLFQIWLKQNNPSLCSISKKTIFDFLSYLQNEKGLSARTINSHRNSLQWPMKLSFGLNLKTDDFKLFTKGIFNKAPPKPRLIPEWSINHALEMISNSYKNPKNIADLTSKTLFLTALASGNRVSELQAITRSNIRSPANNSSITLAVRHNFRRKNETMDRIPPPISFDGLGSRHPLCPVTTIKKYIEMTKHAEHKDNLFVHPKTLVPLKSGRLNYWLTKAITKFDPNHKGRAHDLRKFSFSISWARGIPLQEIVKKGFWTTPNPFLNKYCIELDKVPQCVAGTSKL